MANLELTLISTESEHETQTKVIRTDDRKKSVIDYIIIRKSDQNNITENVVDENGALRFRDENYPDHNTLTITINWDTPKEGTTIKDEN